MYKANIIWADPSKWHGKHVEPIASLNGRYILLLYTWKISLDFTTETIVQ